MLQKNAPYFQFSWWRNLLAVNSGDSYIQSTSILLHSPRQPSQDSLITRQKWCNEREMLAIRHLQNNSINFKNLNLIAVHNNPFTYFTHMRMCRYMTTHILCFVLHLLGLFFQYTLMADVRSICQEFLVLLWKQHVVLFTLQLSDNVNLRERTVLTEHIMEL